MTLQQSHHFEQNLQTHASTWLHKSRFHSKSREIHVRLCALSQPILQSIHLLPMHDDMVLLRGHMQEFLLIENSCVNLFSVTPKNYHMFLQVI